MKRVNEVQQRIIEAAGAGELTTAMREIDLAAAELRDIAAVLLENVERISSAHGSLAEVLGK